jgi:hypothetical protein
LKNRALPHIGPDAVKISSPDGSRSIFVVRGTTAPLNAKTGVKADECHDPF